MVTLIIVSLVSFCLIQTADCTCANWNDTSGQSGGGSTFHISENDPMGTFVLNGTKDASENVTISFNEATALANELKSSFKLTNAATSFSIVNTKVIDLEDLWKQYGKDMSRIVVNIKCKNNSLSPVIAVDPVDEFPPLFNSSTFRISVPENTNVGKLVFDLAGVVHDDDIPPSAGDLVYTTQERTAVSYFACDPKTGHLTLRTALDYDAPGAQRILHVNLHVAEFNGRHLEGTASLKVTVTNVEDVPPYFIYPNCPPPCMAPLYDSLTSLAYTGPLHIEPRPFKGGDNEGFGTQLVYSITQGNTHKMFAIDPITGDVSQSISVKTANAPEPEFRLIVEVKKNISTDLAAIAVLVIRVQERLENASASCSRLPSPLSAAPVAGPDLLMPLIVIGIIAALSFGGLIIIFVMYRRKQNDSHVRPIQVKPGMQNGGIQGLTIGRPEYNNKAFSNALPVFDKKQPLSTLK